MTIKQHDTYDDWMVKLKEKYSDDEIQLQKRKIRNIKEDNVNYRQLKSIIPKKNIPKTLDNYQDLKYNGGRDWQLTKLDYQRRKKLIDCPELKLPNAEKATIDDRKMTDYLFGGNIENGLIKGRLITDKLGYDINNYLEFKNEILKQSKCYPTKFKLEDKYGKRYEQKMILYGKGNHPVNIIVSWNANAEGTKLTSAYIKEV